MLAASNIKLKENALDEAESLNEDENERDQCPEGCYPFGKLAICYKDYKVTLFRIKAIKGLLRSTSTSTASQRLSFILLLVPSVTSKVLDTPHATL